MDGERAVWFDSKESILAKVPFRRGGRPIRSDLHRGKVCVNVLLKLILL